MYSVGFDYKGKFYSGSLIASDAEAPEYYWYFFDNNDLILELGDCVSFTGNKENLVTTRKYNDKYYELINSIKEAILPYIPKY